MIAAEIDGACKVNQIWRAVPSMQIQDLVFVMTTNKARVRDSSVQAMSTLDTLAL